MHNLTRKTYSYEKNIDPPLGVCCINKDRDGDFAHFILKKTQIQEVLYKNGKRVYCIHAIFANISNI